MNTLCTIYGPCLCRAARALIRKVIVKLKVRHFLHTVMPICTTCTHAAPYLYTTYESDYNLRLEQCTSCGSFVDPYVEFDALTLFIDLILLKRGVYRHLLYNRGTEPRRVGKQAAPTRTAEESREKRRWRLLAKMCPSMIFLDAFIRWSYLNPSNDVIWTSEMLRSFALVLVGATAETLAFHLGVMLACCCVLKVVDMFRGATRAKSSVRQEFRLSLVPLSLFYSSLTKYFLLLLLTVWLPASPSTSTSQSLPPWVLTQNQAVRSAFQMLDDDKLDREWVIRNVLGGMSAGFGLRVILDDIQPLFTTLIIIFGWAAKTAVAQIFSTSGWLRDETFKAAWLAYSIP